MVEVELGQENHRCNYMYMMYNQANRGQTVLGMELWITVKPFAESTCNFKMPTNFDLFMLYSKTSTTI